MARENHYFSEMKFRTELSNINLQNKIGYSDRIFAVGSCFTDNIGGKLTDAKFTALVNPFGVMFNPVSISKCAEIISGGRSLSKADLVYEQGEWHSFYHSSSFSHHDPQTALDAINCNIQKQSRFLDQSSVILVTAGTSIIYEYIKSGETVSNCHRIPGKEFSRKRLSPGEVYDVFSGLIDSLKNTGKEKRYIFTVSPVRHLKEGFHENQLSKASLILGIEEICRKYPEAEYFPAYELLLDDLRDYRFFGADLVHPSAEAIDYIWQKFAEAVFTDETLALVTRIEKLNLSLKHRLRNPHSEPGRKFLKSVLEEAESVQRENAEIDFTPEINKIKTLLQDPAS